MNDIATEREGEGGMEGGKKAGRQEVSDDLWLIPWDPFRIQRFGTMGVPFVSSRCLFECYNAG